MELNSYLEQLEEQIRNRKAKAEVIEEIRNHIEDQAEFYEKEGMSAEEAIEQAVRQMGDPVEVGIEKAGPGLEAAATQELPGPRKEH